MSVTTHDNKSDISKWLGETFKKDNFTKFDFQITGSSEKGDGYVGDIHFVDVTALTSNEESKTFNLVVKSGKQDEIVRKNMPVRLAFEREIFVYGAVLPTFRQFEEERNVKFVDSFMPKCFNTLLYENQEVLIFQNLKAIGYDLHDRFQPLDINHLRLTMENYGKWHGLSIAYRDQKPDEFNKLFGNMEDIFEAFKPIMEGVMKQTEPTFYATLGRNEPALAERLRERLKKGFFDTIQDLLNVDEVNTVFIHGDCWNNNLMFKCDDTTSTEPIASKFLDFQLSTMITPIYDLAYHLYSTASEKELAHFKELLQVYHSSLSSTIKSLGSDPEKLFPYSELVRQWKAYSTFGLILATLVLPIALINKEDVIDLRNFDGEHMADMMETVRQKNESLLLSRYIAVVKHFLEFNDF